MESRRHLRDRANNIFPRTIAMKNDKGPKSSRLSIEDTGMVKQRMGMGAPVSRFDPYQGAMTAKPPSQKRDLRKVGEWLEAKKRAERLKKENAGD
jgi:hypothetical protein